MTDHIKREDRKHYTPDESCVEVDVKYGGTTHTLRVLVTFFQAEEPRSWDYPGAPGHIEAVAWRCAPPTVKDLATEGLTEADAYTEKCIWCDDRQETECSGEWVDFEDEKLTGLLVDALWSKRGSYY